MKCVANQRSVKPTWAYSICFFVTFDPTQKIWEMLSISKYLFKELKEFFFLHQLHERKEKAYYKTAVTMVTKPVSTFDSVALANQCNLFTFKSFAKEQQIHHPIHHPRKASALDLTIECCDITLQCIYLSEKVGATGSAWVQRLGFRGLEREREGREEERGHLLWPRQGINKQTGCQAISTHSEQTGRLTNLPHIYGTKPGITQVRKVRCWNNTRRCWCDFGANPWNLIYMITLLSR